MRRFIRRVMSVILRHVRSRKISDILLWPVSRRLFSRGYSEVVTIMPRVRVRVYGDMEDMVNKMLMFMSDTRELAWEPMTARLVRALAPKVKVAVVAGSHIGYYPLLIAGTHPAATVYAFEPNPTSYKKLVDNISLNNFSHIVARESALGATAGEQKMFFDFGQSSFVESSRLHAGEGMVKVQTLDQVSDSEFVQAPNLLILDAEGYEPQILRGALRTIEKHHPDIIFELNPSALKAAGSSPRELCDVLQARGHSLFIIEDDYSHSTYGTLPSNIVLTPYKGSLLPGISFVNAFATVHPERIQQYIQK